LISISTSTFGALLAWTLVVTQDLGFFAFGRAWVVVLDVLGGAHGGILVGASALGSLRTGAFPLAGNLGVATRALAVAVGLPVQSADLVLTPRAPAGFFLALCHCSEDETEHDT